MTEKIMTEKQYKNWKRIANFLIPLIDAVLMVVIYFGTSLSIILKIIAMLIILIIGNVIKFEIQKRVATAAALYESKNDEKAKPK